MTLPKKELPKKHKKLSVQRQYLHRWVNMMYPIMGIKRYKSYILHRIGRMKSSDKAIAKGFAAGVAVSMTPFLGLHFFMAAFLAWVTRGNVVVSLIGTVVGNPWTFPFILWIDHKLGNLILNISHQQGEVREIMQNLKQCLKGVWHLLTADGRGNLSEFLDDCILLFKSMESMMLGGAVMGVVAWFVSYGVILRIVRSYRTIRKRQLDLKKQNAVLNSSSPKDML